MDGDALTTAESMKGRLTLTGATWDGLLTALARAVTARMQRICDRTFAEATHTNELHDGSNTTGNPRNALIVRNAPIQTISVIEYQAGTNSSPSWQTISVDDYHADLSAGIIYFPLGCPRGFQNIRITYTGGYSAEDMPAELVEVCEEVVVKLFKRRESEGRLSETFGDSSISWSEKWFSDEQRAIVASYRRGYSL